MNEAYRPERLLVPLVTPFAAGGSEYKNAWVALALSCLLGPVLFLWSAPLFYSPRNFIHLVLPRFPAFLLNTARVYPSFFLKLLPVPVLARFLWRRRDSSASLQLS